MMTDLDVYKLLRTIDDSDLGTDMISLGLVTDVTVEDDVEGVRGTVVPFCVRLYHLQYVVAGGFLDAGTDWCG